MSITPSRSSLRQPIVWHLRSCRRSNRSWVRPGPPGIDGDPRIAILHLNTLVDTAGEFASYDLLPRSLFPDSNEREMVYIAGDLEVGSPLHIGTIAHEITHLLDYSYRPNRQLWLEEGIAQLVEHRIGLDTVLSAYRYVAKQPVQLNSWGPLQLDDRHYGAGFLYVLYLWEQYGDEAIHDLLVSDYDGIAVVEDVLAARDVDHAVFFSEWIGALVLDSTGSKDSHFQTLRLPQVCGLETVASLPRSTNVEVPQFAPRYTTFTGSGIVEVSFTGSATVGPIGADANNGQWMWWAGPADESAARLTREVDLSDLDQATLSFSTWHDTGYSDSGAVLVSTDGGSAWTVVGGAESQPVEIGELSGINGYTGWSGSGEAPEWVRETIDLSAYAGRNVLVRFQYTTDLYEGRIGFAIDDIELVHLEWTDGAEDDQSEWIAEGFQRAPESIPQTWIVQVIDGDAVRTIGLESGRADFEIDLGEGGTVTVATAATVVGTGAHTSYDLSATGEADLMSASEGVDTFDVPCSGWEYEATPTYDLEQINGELVVTARGPDVFTWSAREGVHGVVTVAADVTFGASWDGAGGLMCRLSADGFYEVNISVDGSYLVGVAYGFDYEVLADWTESEAINTGPAAHNLVALECTENEVAVFVGGVELARFEDDRLGPGQVAVLGLSFGDGEFVVSYDNVAVEAEPSAGDGVVAYDGFEEASPQWLPFTDRGSRTGQDEGEFVLSVLSDDWSAVAYSSDQLSDVMLSADFRITEVAPDGLVGATCHTTEQFDQYLFLLSMDGGYAVQVVVGVDVVDIVPWSFGSGVLIEPDTANHMQITCANGRLTWVLNGWTLADVENPLLEAGRVGFVAYSYEYGHLEMRIDNVKITDLADDP